ncbi:MAG: hypothetical protein HYZ75_06985 [Elusimicrobia bacterium]|nr:hypothetical protein [Elusimicrobiota bacterium]
MTSAAFIFLLLAPPAYAAVDCRGAYTPDYETDWNITRKNWDAACAKGQEPHWIRRQWQAAFQKDCVARFKDARAAGKLSKGEAAGYCARGNDGKTQLLAKIGEKPPAPAAAPKARSPYEFPADWGPVATALVEARREWQSDACLSGLYFDRTPDGRHKPVTDTFGYVFHSARDRKQSYIYTHGLKDGKVKGERVAKMGFARCFGLPKAGVKAVMSAAGEAGLGVNEADDLDASLDFIAKGAKKEDFRIRVNSGEAEWAGRILAALAGKEFMHVKVGKSAVAVDSRSGYSLYYGPDFDAKLSGVSRE